MNDKAMYSQARDVAEPEFCEVLKKTGMQNVRQGSKNDDISHVDVFASKNGIEWKFDIKDLSPSYAGKSTRYNMSEHFVDDYSKSKAAFSHHMIACRLYGKDGAPLGKYACFKTSDVIEKGLVKKFKRRDDGREFWLFDIKEAMDSMVMGKQWKIIG